MTGSSNFPAKQQSSSGACSEPLSQSLEKLIERAEELVASLSSAEIEAWSLQIGRLLHEDLKPNNYYYWPLKTALAKLESNLNEEQLQIVKEILVSVKDDIDHKRLSPASGENRDNKLFEIVLASLNLYLGIAAAIIGLLIQKIHLTFPHTNSAFFAVIFAAVSFLLGVFAQSWTIDSLGKKRSLRESVLCQPVLQMLRFQIIFLAISIVFLFVYWWKGGKIGG